MRQFKFALTCFLLLAAIQSCKPKDKHQAMQDLLRRDSAKNQIKEDKKDGSVRDIIVQKWKVTDAFPAPENESDKQQMLSTVIEFTRDGRVMITEKGETKQAAFYTLTMDDRYMLSTDEGKDEVDTILISEINPNKLVLIGEKDKRKIIFQRYR
jgi:hypothetical protein